MSDTTLGAESPIFFWRETEIYGFLSQWYYAPFTAPALTVDDPPTTFWTCEQYMMYYKAILFKDFEIAEQILQEPDPRQQKALGRKVKGFDEKVWVQNRETIVEDGNWFKFSCLNERTDLPDLREKLLETGNRELVEAAPNDRIWGIGYKERNAHGSRTKWGMNLLGKAIMRVRNRLQVQSTAHDAISS